MQPVLLAAGFALLLQSSVLAERLSGEQEVDIKEHMHASQGATANSSVLDRVVSDLSGTLIGGRFRLLRALGPEWPQSLSAKYTSKVLLGAGTFGAAFRAVDTQDNKQVVVKLFLDDGGKVIRADQKSEDTDTTIQAAKRECLVAQRLQEMGGPVGASRFMLCLHDGVADAHVPHIVLEDLGDTNLEEYLDQQWPIPFKDAYRIVIMLLQGLKHIEKRYVHRDVKPGNIMVWQENGNPYLKFIDFGMLVTKGTGGYGGGTPDTMPPENLVPGYKPKASFDMYSVGATAFEVLCGENAYDRLAVELMEKFPKKSEDWIWATTDKYVAGKVKGFRMESLCKPSYEAQSLYSYVATNMLSSVESTRPSAQRAFRTLLPIYKNKFKAASPKVPPSMRGIVPEEQQQDDEQDVEDQEEEPVQVNLQDPVNVNVDKIMGAQQLHKMPAIQSLQKMHNRAAQTQQAGWFDPANVPDGKQ